MTTAEQSSSKKHNARTESAAIQDLRRVVEAEDNLEMLDKYAKSICGKLDAGERLKEPLPLGLAIKLLYRRWEASLEKRLQVKLMEISKR